MKFNPSHANRWMKCPASVVEAEKYPPIVADYKNDGIAVHRLLQLCLMTKQDNANKYLGNQLVVNDQQIIVGSKMIESVNKVLEYIKGVSTDTTVVGCEVAINPTKSLIEGLAGAIDVVLIHPVEDGTFDVEIIDYKYGFTPVEALDNWQLIIYAWGIRSLYPQIAFNNFKLTIVQPNAELKGLPISNSVTMPVFELLHTHKAIIDAVEAAKAPNPPFIAGEEQCYWCPAKGNCSAYVELAGKKSNLSLDVENVAQQAVNADPKELSNEKLREIFEAAPMIRKMLEAIEAEIMRRFEDGVAVEGMKVVRGSGRKSWAFDEAEMAIKLNKMGIPKDMVYEKKLLSFNKACELKWRKRNDEVASLSKRQIETLEKEYIKKGDGKNLVVLESDPRPAVEVSVNHLFKPVEPAPLPDWI